MMGVAMLLAQRNIEISELKEEIETLRNAIRLHRDERGNDRCWLDDERLYSVLPEGKKADMVLPCRQEFLKNCARYWADRQPMSSMYEQVTGILQKELGVTFTGADQNLTEAGLDSLDIVDGIMNLEEELDVTITDEEMDGIKTIGDLVALIEKKKA